MTSFNRSCGLSFSRVAGLGLAVLSLVSTNGCADDRDDDSPAGIGKNKKKDGKSKQDADAEESNPGGGPVDDTPSQLPGANSNGNGGSGKGQGPDEGSKGDECDKIDFVFVIDDSRSMAMDQLGLIGDFPNFISVLNAYRTRDGKPLDYRIAVTTSSISYEVTQEGENFKGDDGLFRTTNSSPDGRSCWSDTRRWIERSDDDLQERFSCAAQVGINGLGHEMQMLALNMSLEERVESGDHEDFLRNDALLAAVILTDEDDCSTEDQKIENFDTCSAGEGSFPDSLMSQSRVLKRLDAVKGNSRKRWALGVLSKYVCLPDLNGGFINVEPPKRRLKGLVSEAGENAVYVEVCDDSYAKHLDKVLDTFTEACENFPPPL